MYEEVIKKLDQTPNLLKTQLTEGIDRHLLSPYKFKVVFNQRDVGIFGYGSGGCTRNVVAFRDSTQEIAITVGNLCENFRGAILLGGEHRNNKAVNYIFSGHTDFLHMAKNSGVNIDSRASFSKGPVTIGSNVTLSINHTILSGVTIGNGAVIGAGAVVTKNVPPFAIVTGNPAKILKYRFDEKTIEALEKIRWWDMHVHVILQNLDLINSLPDPEALEKLQSLGESAYRKPDNNYLVFRASENNDGPVALSFRGAEVNGKFIKYDDLPPEFRFFLSQLSLSPGSVFYMIKDIFKLSGLAA